MGLHAATDGGRDPEQEEEEDGLRFPEAPGQGPPHTAEEPIERLPAGQDFQLQSVTVTKADLLFPWKQEGDCDEWTRITGWCGQWAEPSELLLITVLLFSHNQHLINLCCDWLP